MRRGTDDVDDFWRPGPQRHLSASHHKLALEMLDELAAVGPQLAVVVADAGYGANADLRGSLHDRGLAYALPAKAEMTTHPESAEPRQPTYGSWHRTNLPKSPVAPRRSSSSCTCPRCA
ncbi:transposase [Streptomyces sp. NBC_01525]